MTALPDWDMSDAELAEAAITGDRGAFAEIYDRYSSRLFDFCVSMLRDRESAADCVQDTFCTAAARLSSLRDLGKLRPWLYAIARNEALRRIRERRREQASDELPETASDEPGPEALAARTELAALIAQAAAGLSDRDREILDLAYRHGLDGPEIAEALGTSAATTRTLLHRLRETVERSLGAVLVARHARSGRGCAELRDSLKDWDGEFTVLLRKRVARHIESCPECSEDRRGMVNPAALLGAGAVVFLPAPILLREKTLNEVQLTCASTPLVSVVPDAPPVGLGARVLNSRTMIAAGLSVGVVGLTLVLFGAWPSAQHSPQQPTVVTGAVTSPQHRADGVPSAPVPIGRPVPVPVPSATAPGVSIAAGVPVAPAPSAASSPAENSSGAVGAPVAAPAPTAVPAPSAGTYVPAQADSSGPSDSSGVSPGMAPSAATAAPAEAEPNLPAQPEPPKSITTSGDTTTTPGGLSTTSDGLPSGGLSVPSGGLPTLPGPSIPVNSFPSGGLTSIPGGLTSTSGGSIPKPGSQSTTSGGKSTTSGGSSISSSGGGSDSSGTSDGGKK